MELEQPAIIDSSVWIGYFDRDDSHTDRAKEVLTHVFSAGVSVIISTFVIQEVITVLLYQKKKQTADAFLEFIEQSRTVVILTVDMDLIQKAADFARKQGWKPKMSLTDWTLIAVALASKSNFFTFDRQLGNTAKRLQIQTTGVFVTGKAEI